jgi:hypothetical protein
MYFSSVSGQVGEARKQDYLRLGCKPCFLPQVPAALLSYLPSCPGSALASPGKGREGTGREGPGLRSGSKKIRVSGSQLLPVCAKASQDPRLPNKALSSTKSALLAKLGQRQGLEEAASHRARVKVETNAEKSALPQCHAPTCIPHVLS